MKNTSYRSGLAFIILVTAFALPGIAQDNGGGGDGGGGGGGNAGGGQTPTPVAQDDFDTGSLVGGDAQIQEIPDFELQSITPEFTDERLQPFVGPSSENIIHPFSQNAAGGGAAGGGGGFTLRGGGGGAGGFGTGSEFGFTVPRSSIRAALRNRIIVPNSQFRDSNTSNRFQQRLVSIPAMQGISGVTIAVENRRAVLTGIVQSEQQRQLVERMARLEPGIYSIDNQITVGN